MNNNLPEDKTKQHTSDGGYRSVYHKTAVNLPDVFSAQPEITRDTEDVLTISSLLRAVSALLILLTISIGTNVFLSVRKADRIVVDKSSNYN